MHGFGIHIQDSDSSQQLLAQVADKMSRRSTRDMMTHLLMIAFGGSGYDVALVKAARRLGGNVKKRISKLAKALYGYRKQGTQGYPLNNTRLLDVFT